MHKIVLKILYIKKKMLESDEIVLNVIVFLDFFKLLNLFSFSPHILFSLVWLSFHIFESVQKDI